MERSSRATGVQIALAVIAVMLVLWSASKIVTIILITVLAVVLACGLHPVMSAIQRKGEALLGWRCPRWAVALSLVLSITLAIVGLVLFLGARLWTEGAEAAESLPQYADTLDARLEQLHRTFPQIPANPDIASMAQDQLGNVGSYLWERSKALLGVLGVVGAGVTVLVLTFYLLISGEKLFGTALLLVVPRHRQRVAKASAEASEVMGYWLRGQAILVTAMTVTIALAMMALGLPHPLLLGLIGGVGELIPMVGPFLAAWIAVPLAFLTMPWWVGVCTAVFFVVLALVEGNFVVPKVMQKNVSLPPAVTIVVVLAGASLFGVIGALLAVPITAATRVYLKWFVIPAIEGERPPAGQA